MTGLRDFNPVPEQVQQVQPVQPVQPVLQTVPNVQQLHEMVPEERPLNEEHEVLEIEETDAANDDSVKSTLQQDNSSTEDSRIKDSFSSNGKEDFGTDSTSLSLADFESVGEKVNLIN